MFNTKFVTYYPENMIVIFSLFFDKSPYLTLKIPTRRQITENYSTVSRGDCLFSCKYKSIGRLNLKGCDKKKSWANLVQFFKTRFGKGLRRATNSVRITLCRADIRNRK
jgi:hypothetical protein